MRTGRRGATSVVSVMIMLRADDYTAREIAARHGLGDETTAIYLKTLHDAGFIYIKYFREGSGSVKPPRVWAWQPSPYHFKDAVYICKTARPKKFAPPALDSSTANMLTRWSASSSPRNKMLTV